MYSFSLPEIFVEQGGGSLSTPKGDFLERKQLPAGTGEIELHITKVGPKISFSYRMKGKKWTQLVQGADATGLSTSKAGGFTGSFIGPFARLKMANSGASSIGDNLPD